MGVNMKILIAYDGSDCAEAALDDLRRAGLPREAEAVVISVAELWLPAQSSYVMTEADFAEKPSGGGEDPRTLAESAGARIQANLPGWKVRTEPRVGPPAGEIIKWAEEWQPDLIVIGSHGRSALGRLILGSVSQKVVAEAACSVRVSRGSVGESDSPARLLIGLDGSPAAEAAVRTVAARVWPQGSQARLVTAIGPSAHLLGPMIGEIYDRARNIQRAAEAELRAAGLPASAICEEKDPRHLLPAEAEEWGADCVFVGASARHRFGRLLLGSVATAVVARTPCSVEVVRLSGQR